MLFTEYNEEAHINHVKESSYENGYGKGYDSGIDIMSQLYQKLKELGRLDDFDKAMSDQGYRNQLIEEFFSNETHISSC